eukprot:6031275-Pleurochrysis_carterae.AAC.1
MCRSSVRVSRKMLELDRRCTAVEVVLTLWALPPIGAPTHWNLSLSDAKPKGVLGDTPIHAQRPENTLMNSRVNRVTTPVNQLISGLERHVVNPCSCCGT